MKFLKDILLLITIGFLFISKIFSQQPVLFDKLTTLNGLSNNIVYCIYQDKKGFIWVGTANGLNCYDGYSFTNYFHDENNKNSISGNFITSITGDENGNLWIGVWDGGLNFYERSTGKFYSYLSSPKDKLDNNFKVWAIVIDKHKNIWAGTIGGGLNVYDPKLKVFKKFTHQPSDINSISSDSISSLFEDSFGNVWVGTFNDGLNLYNRNNNTFTVFKHSTVNSNTLCSNQIATIFEDNRNNLWIGTKDKGVSVVLSDRKTIRNFNIENNSLNCNNIRSINQDENNLIWIGTDGGGINIYDPEKEMFSFVENDPDNPTSIGSNVVFSIYKSLDGIIWAGTYKEGLNLYDKNKFKFQTFSKVGQNGEGLSANSVFSILEDSQGFIWFGTDGGGLNLYDPVKNKFTYFRHNPSNKNSISGDVIECVYEDSYGNIWVGTFTNGLNLMKYGTNEFIHFKNNPSDTTSISNNTITSIVEDADKNLWFGTLEGGLNLLDRKTMTFKHFKKGNPNKTAWKPSNSIFSIIEDKKRGGLWLGTEGGLSYFDTEQMIFKDFFVHSNESKSLSNSSIKSLYQDSNGDIWIGTNSIGLYCYSYSTGRFISYKLKSGILSNEIASILEDNNHAIWISTNVGLSKFNSVNNSFTNYTLNEGLQKDGFLYGSAYKRKNGELFFGGKNGVSIIKPAGEWENRHIPLVVFSSFLLFNKEVRPEDKWSPLEVVISESEIITLKHYQSVISFEFTAISYTNPEKNQYAYKLEGFDKDWNYIGNKRSVTFTNLKPQTYVLHVKASNDDGIWNEEGTSLTIVQLPIWSETWWFRFLILIVVSTFIYLFFNYRIRAINNQRLRLKQLVKESTLELEKEKAVVEEQNIILKAKSNEIQTMVERKRIADEEKLRFFTNISHEIRTPLTLILGPLEKVSESPILPDNLKPEITRIHRNALNLKRLINQILDFRKIETSNYPLFVSKIDAIKALKEISASFYDIALQKKIHFNILSDYGTLEAMIDLEKLDKIVINLLSNAFKFTPDGGEVRLIIKTIKPKEPHIKEYLSITVEDTGKGIPVGQLDKVFDRFYRVDTKENHNPEGTGIGLAIAKGLTELHHGKIKVESEQGKGARFTVLLPLGIEHYKKDEINLLNSDFVIDHSNTEQLSKASIPFENQTSGNKKKPLVLIVEDNTDLRHYIIGSLKNNYQVIEAANGIKGLELAKKRIPQLIVSDIMMPEMDGLEMCRILKNEIETSHIPIILLTAKSSQEHKLIGLQTGADDYIIKPFDSLELELKIANIINNRELLKKRFSTDFVLETGNLSSSTIDDKFLNKVLDIIDKNLANPDFKITHIVNELAMSRSVFYIKIRELTGFSPYDFIKIGRLKKASQLLLQNIASPTEISYMVGFSDVSHFYKCFKKQFGLSPGDYIASLNA